MNFCDYEDGVVTDLESGEALDGFVRGLGNCYRAKKGAHKSYELSYK